MTIIYFAHARRAAGTSREEIPGRADLTPTQLWDVLVQRHPALAELRPSARLARGEEFLPEHATIAAGDEISVLPPVAGG